MLAKSGLLTVAALLGLATLDAGAQLLQPQAVRPDVLMRSVTSEVIAVLKDDVASGRPTDVAQLVQGRILPLFDFQRMTGMAMARNWRLATSDQQAALTEEFKALLVRTYASALAAYRDEALEYRPLRAAPGDTEVLVRSFLRRPGVEPLTIDYDMHDGPAGWKVFDVKIAGISLVLNYRESFAAEVRSAGIDGLIKSLSDKNRAEVAAAVAEAARLAPLLLIYAK